MYADVTWLDDRCGSNYPSSAASAVVIVSVRAGGAFGSVTGSGVVIVRTVTAASRVCRPKTL